MTESTIIPISYDRIKEKKAIKEAFDDIKKQQGEDSFEVYKYFLNQFSNFYFNNSKSKTELINSIDFLTKELSRNIQTTIEQINSNNGKNFNLKGGFKLFAIDFEKLQEEFDAITVIGEGILNNEDNQEKVETFIKKFLEHLNETGNLKYALQNRYYDLTEEERKFYDKYHQIIIDELKKLGFSDIDNGTIIYLSNLIHYFIISNKNDKNRAGVYFALYKCLVYNIKNKNLDFRRIHILSHEFCHFLQFNYLDKAGIDENNLFQIEPQAEMFGPICMILENYKLLVKRYNLDELNKNKEKNKEKIEEIKLKIREELIRIISNYFFRLSFYQCSLKYNPKLFINIFMKVIDDVVNYNGKIILDDGSKQEAISLDGTINFRTIYEYTAKRALEHYQALNELTGKEKIKTKIPKRNDKGELVEEEINLGFAEVLNYLKYFYDNNFNYSFYAKKNGLPRLKNLLEGIKEYLKNSLGETVEKKQEISDLISNIDEFLSDEKKDKSKLLNITNSFSKLIINLNIEDKLNNERFKGQLTHNSFDLAELYNYLVKDINSNDLNYSINIDQYLYNKYIVMPKLIQEIEGLSGQEKLEKQKELLRINSINQRFIYQYNLKLSTFKREIDAIDFRIQELKKVKNIRGNKIAYLKAEAEINTLKQRKLDKLGLIIKEYKERKKIIEELKSKSNYILGLSEEEKSKFDKELKAKLEEEVGEKIGRLGEKIKNLEQTKEKKQKTKKEKIEQIEQNKKELEKFKNIYTQINNNDYKKDISLEDIGELVIYYKNDKYFFLKLLDFFIKNDKNIENPKDIIIIIKLIENIIDLIKTNINDSNYINSIIEIITNKNSQNINFIDDIYNKLTREEKEKIKEIIKNKIEYLFNSNDFNSKIDNISEDQKNAINKILKYTFISGNIDIDININNNSNILFYRKPSLLLFRLFKKNEIYKILNELGLNDEQKEKALYPIKIAIFYNFVYDIDNIENKIELIRNILLDIFSEETKEEKEEFFYKILIKLLSKNFDLSKNQTFKDLLYEINNQMGESHIEEDFNQINNDNIREFIELFKNLGGEVEDIAEIVKDIAEKVKELITNENYKNNNFLKYLILDLVEDFPFKIRMKEYLCKNLKKEINEFFGEDIVKEKLEDKTQQNIAEKYKTKTFVEKIKDVRTSQDNSVLALQD